MNESYIQHQCFCFQFCKFSNRYGSLKFTLFCVYPCVCIVNNISFTFHCRIFLIKRMVAWYFQRKMNKNSTELQKLRSEKKKILEEVQEKETYKVALEILKKFADPGPVRPLEMATLTPNNRLQQQQQPIARTPLTPAMRTPQPLPRQRILTSPQIASQFRSPQMMASQQQQNQQMLNRSAFFQSTPVLQRPRTPFPIIDQRDKGMLEKMVDYLIGDGPANRFAMICKNCFGHNGMVLQEEYDYASFKCAFCSTLNPAKKQRPIAPRLEVPTRTEILDSSSSTSEEEKNSPPESDAEIDNVRSNTNAHEENNTSIEENNDNNVDDDEIKKIDETEITEVAEEQEPKTEIEKKDD